MMLSWLVVARIYIFSCVFVEDAFVCFFPSYHRSFEPLHP